MGEVSKKIQNELPRIKECVEAWYTFFKDNYDRFHKIRSYVFRSTLSADDISVLANLKKPELEFNILEAYVSRLRGEFSKQEPSLSVTSAENAKVDPNTIQIVEDHMRAIMFANNTAEYDVYTDLLSGGFSAIKFWTEYENEKSFHQNIKWGRLYDPTLSVFDPLARESHKGDGNYAGELFPKRRVEFEREYPWVNTNSLGYTRNNQDFNWSYRNQKEDILLICDFYEKKKKSVRIVQLANGKVLTKKDYDKFMEQWKDNAHIEQPSAIVFDRMTDVETICRYRFIENQVIEYEETDYKILPIIFVDGNSVLLRDATGSSVTQMTRPYVYNAIGAQKLKNFAGQTLANELENMVQHKWLIAEESISAEYAQALKKPQLPAVVVYKAFQNNDASKPVPPPREVMRPPIPQEITQTFAMSDSLTQTILGSYDASLGINNNQLSGVAIIEGATQSNSTAMPYVVGFLQAYTQLGVGIADLIPKYYVTPRTIPLMGMDGKNSYTSINSPGQPNLKYDENSLKVKVEAGVNFQIQKSRSLNQMTAMMQASQSFNAFMNQKGLVTLVRNMEVEGQDQLEQAAEQWMQQQEQQMQQQQQQAAQQPNPLQQKMQIEQQKLQLAQQKQALAEQQAQTDNQYRAAEITNDAQSSENDRMRILLQAHQAHAENSVQLKKADAEDFSRATELALKTADMQHTHQHKDMSLMHDIVSSAVSSPAMSAPAAPESLPSSPQQLGESDGQSS